MWRVLVVLLFLGLAACTEPVPPVVFHNTDITGAAFGPSLAGLKDSHGTSGALASYRGKAVLVFFGYTSCPDVCPTTLARLVGVMKILGADAGRVQVFLVTVDPDRDTPDKLAAYVSAFSPAFLGLSGDMLATAAVAKEFKAYFARSKPGANEPHEHHHEHAEDAYSVDHSTGNYAFDTAGRVRLYIRDDASIDAVASDLKLLLALK